VAITRFPRKVASRRRSNHLAVVVLPSEAIAFQAYRLLHYHGISPENLAIVGEGYSSPERVGLVGPMQIAHRQARLFACYGAALGFALGLGLLLVGERSLGFVLLGAMAIASMGSMGGVVAGILFGLWGEGSKANIYHRHLRQGRYLLMLEGPETLVRWGQEVLSHYYVPDDV
jgi:hypothetical protein